MEDYGPDIISVMDDSGSEREFEIVDRYDTDDGRSYLALIPVFATEADMLADSGELLILRISEEDDTVLEPVDDEEYDRIGAIFEERLADLFEFEDEDEE